jgi:hypothetical protein
MPIIYPKPAVQGVWADGAVPITDIVEPPIPFIEAGWLESTTPPARQYFNWALNYAQAGIRYFMQRGIVDWDNAELYQANAFVQYSGFVYQSSANNNQGNQPNTNPNVWTQSLATNAQIQALLTNYLLQSVAIATFAPIASPTFTGNPKAPQPPSNDNSTSLANTQWVQQLISAYVTSAVFNSTVAALASLNYVNGTFAPLTDFSGGGTGGNPGFWDKNAITGHIHQFGNVPFSGNSPQSVTFPLQFPNQCVSITVTPFNAVQPENFSISGYNVNGFTVISGAGEAFLWSADGF